MLNKTRATSGPAALRGQNEDRGHGHRGQRTGILDERGIEAVAARHDEDLSADMQTLLQVSDRTAKRVDRGGLARCGHDCNVGTSPVDVAGV
jgi:hypothetical protein